MKGQERMPERKGFTPTFLNFSFPMSTSKWGLSASWNTALREKTPHSLAAHSTKEGSQGLAYEAGPGLEYVFFSDCKTHVASTKQSCHFQKSGCRRNRPWKWQKVAIYFTLAGHSKQNVTCVLSRSIGGFVCLFHFFLVGESAPWPLVLGLEQTVG